MNDLKKSLARNTALNIAGYFWTALIGLLLTPLLVHFVGLKDFGLYTFLVSAAGWLWILDLGTSTGLVCFLSQYAAEGKEERFAECLSSTLILKAAVGLLAGTVVFLAGGPVARYLDPQDPPRAFWILQFVVWGYAVTNLSSAYNAALSARQRMDIPVRLGLWLSLPSTAAAVALLIWGKGLAGFAASNLGFALVYLLMVRRSAIQTSPSRAISPPRFRPRELAPVLLFSLKNAGNRLIHTFYRSADRLALGNDLPSLSLYQIGASLVGKIRDITALTASASLPALTDLRARGDWAAVNQLFQRGLKYLVLLGLPLTIFSTIFAEELLVLWMGGSLPESATVLRLLAAGYFLHVLTEIAAPMGAALNRPELQLRASLAALAVTLAGYFLGGRSRGLSGLAVSVSTGYGLLGVLLVVLVLRETRGRLSFPARLLGRAFLASLCAAALVCLPAKGLSGPQGWAKNRIGAALFLGTVTAAAVPAYILALCLFRVLDRRDWELIPLMFRRETGLAGTPVDPPPGPAI